MLPMKWRALKPGGGETQSRNKPSTNSIVDDQGLRTLIQLPTLHENHTDSNLVLKYSLNLEIKPIFILNQTHEGSIVSCFLKSCQLCYKTLRLDKEVFMYRGDQGFCSEECRDRQIYLDEIRELERCTRETLASYRSCRGSDREDVSPSWCSKHGRNTKTDRVIFTLL